MEQPRILIVENEIVVADQIRKDLEKLTYHVCPLATSGRESIEIVERERPNLIIMDIMLSGEMDGIETARQISSRFRIPIIYLSAYSDNEIVERAKKTEPFGYLIKPFRSRELQLNVEMALYKHQMETQRNVLTKDITNNIQQVKSHDNLLPICMYCDFVRDIRGHWRRWENYIHDHFDVRLSHGICPKCASNYYKS